jgi:hypothetical protein
MGEGQSSVGELPGSKKLASSRHEQGYVDSSYPRMLSV